MRIACLFLLTGAAAMGAGCTSPYEAAPGANGEDTFRDACLRCHAPVPNGATGATDIYFTLAEDEMNPQYIAGRIQSGTIGMPRFPYITGPELEALAGFVLSRSTLEAN